MIFKQKKGRLNKTAESRRHEWCQDPNFLLFQVLSKL